VPKLVVTTGASRDVSSIIGSKDVTLMHAVCDIIGLNFMTERLLTPAAGAIAGMVNSQKTPAIDRRVIGLTSFSPLQSRIRERKQMRDDGVYPPLTGTDDRVQT